jgi:RNA polymerase sigma-B factor
MSKMRKENEQLVLSYCKTRNPELREPILVAFKWLIDYIARKFSYNRSDFDDLVQIGSIGLLNSLERFDPSKEVDFTTFATPNIIGEIKHYFRDKNRLIKVPRKLMELNSKVKNYIRDTQQEGKSPTIAQIATALGESEEHILESMEVSQPSMVVSLDSPSHKSDSDDDFSGSLLDNLGVDCSTDRLLIKETLEQAVIKLPEREQQVIHLRFYCGLSQMEIGQRLGLSQMHISRLLTKSLSLLRKILHEIL